MRSISTTSGPTLRLSERERHSRLGPPSRLPTIVPTRSSLLQRFLWLIGIGR